MLDLSKETAGALSALSTKELTDLLFDMERDAYEQRPVDIDTFCTSSEFMGDVVFLYPFWREKLRKIHASPLFSPVFEVIVHLPIGSGKSYSSCVSIAYELYKLLCLKQPQDYYKLSERNADCLCVLLRE